MKIDGQCHCGAIAYEAFVDPNQAFICHCEDCQSFSGAPFRVRILAPPAGFTIVRGVPRTYTKVAESGTERVMHFCGSCGTHIYGSARGDDSLPISISGGTTRQKASIRPSAQAWCCSRLPWLSDLEAIRWIDKQEMARPSLEESRR